MGSVATNSIPRPGEKPAYSADAIFYPEKIQAAAPQWYDGLLFPPEQSFDKVIL
jgi:hypothetical protein